MPLHSTELGDRNTFFVEASRNWLGNACRQVNCYLTLLTHAKISNKLLDKNHDSRKIFMKVCIEKDQYSNMSG